MPEGTTVHSLLRDLFNIHLNQFKDVSDYATRFITIRRHLLSIDPNAVVPDFMINSLFLNRLGRNYFYFRIAMEKEPSLVDSVNPLPFHDLLLKTVDCERGLKALDEI
ncbi:hypothetical protein BO71DRAFT_396261 [Aspergillus ellipticus CBS 707.79]|uniref:Uncharacterized protein n=1 Tax=Aspergillus ellipticus CBS 707.79 TaxID=1448320 RepID=A0A319EZ35_9EURO|nr:hypothetical protein BO71DRAFT_396261 [Aspergillus ellipticus CBS 707.79]